MVYRLLVLDIDGTILRSNYRIDKAVKEAIDYVRRKGVYVTLATRRHYSSAKKVAKALKIDSILITHNGAFVANDMNNPLYVERILEDEVDGITKLFEMNDCHVRIKHERFSLANRIKQNQEVIARMTVGDPIFYPINFTDELNEYVNKSPISPLQIEAFFDDKLEGQVLKQAVSERFSTVDVHMYEDNRIEIVRRNVTKARAMLKLAKHFGIAQEEIVAVGDSEADIDMIREAGLGVAMGNASREVKQHADWITRSNDQNGVAYMMKEVFRKQFRIQIRSF